MESRWIYNKETHKADEQPTGFNYPYLNVYDKSQIDENRKAYDKHIASLRHLPVSGTVDWKDRDDVTGKFRIERHCYQYRKGGGFCVLGARAKSCECDVAIPHEQPHQQIVTGETSDGYHTFNELYEFRKVYNALLFNEWYRQGKYEVHKSIRHYEGEECFGGGWFIVVAMLPTGQVSNHYKNEDWNLFKCIAVERAIYPYDRHNANDVLERLKAMTDNQPHEQPQQEVWVRDAKGDVIPMPDIPQPQQDVPYGSKWLIGRARERFRELADKGWDWRSFYNGWLEGRMDALPDIRKPKTTDT